VTTRRQRALKALHPTPIESNRNAQEGSCHSTASCDADDEDADECEFVYSNLDDPKLASCYGLPKSLDYFKGVLRGLGLQVPASMFEQSELDMLGNVGNRCVSHTADGQFACARTPLS